MIKKNKEEQHPFPYERVFIIIAVIIIIITFSFPFLSFLASPNLSSNEISQNGITQDCTKIKIDKNAMIACLDHLSFWESAPPTYCDSTANSGLCNFGLAILKFITRAYFSTMLQRLLYSLSRIITTNTYILPGRSARRI